MSGQKRGQPSSGSNVADEPAKREKQDRGQKHHPGVTRSLRTWVGPVVAGALARVGAWALGLPGDRFLSRDSPRYWSLSEDLLDAYSTTDGALLEIALLRPPGYPAILSLFRVFGDTYATAALLLALVGVVAVFLTYQIGLRLAGPWVASVAAWWLALEPLHIVESSILLTEVSFSVLMLGAILVLSPLARYPITVFPIWRWAIAGLLVAAATFVRPISLYLPLLALLFGVVVARFGNRRRVTLGILMFLAVFAIPVGMWFAHNFSVTGVATFSTIQGVNLALYRAVGAMIHEDGLPVEEARREMRRLVEAETTAEMNPAEVAEVQTRVGIREIVKRPVGYTVSTARGLAFTLFGPGRADIGVRLATGPWRALTLPVIAISFASAVAMLSFSGLGTWRLFRRRGWVPLLLLGLPLLYLLMIGSGQESDSRFRVPLEPLLAILAGIGLESVVAAVRKRRTHSEPYEPGGESTT